MKRNLLIFAAAAMVLGVVACQKENLVEENKIVSSGKTLDEIKVIINPETRVSVSPETGHAVEFQVNDTIFGWDSSIKYAYKCTKVEDDAATFTLITEDAPSAAQGTKINLVYAPGKSINDITTGSSLTIDLSSQDCSALDNLPIIMSATGTVGEGGTCILNFSSNVAIISVINASFPGATNGTYEVSFETPKTGLGFTLGTDGALVVTSSDGSKITSTSQITVASEKASFFFAVPACSSTNNFKITLGANHTFDTGDKSITAGNYINLNGKAFVNGLYYPGTTLPPIQVGNLLWAPVNCGGTNLGDAGLYYQWGRQFGQGYSPTNFVSEQKPLIFDTYDNREVFIKGSDDWCSPNLTSWSNNPCPEGWRVPTKAELETLFSPGSDHSWTASGLTQFPKAGVNSTNGNGDELNEYGYYWSSNTDGTGSWYMKIDSGNEIRMKGNGDNGKRARGMSVRCVKTAPTTN